MATNNDEPSSANAASPLLSDRLSVLCLQAEYVGNVNGNFMHGIKSLDTRYEALRRVRGDGNCFFRSFIFTLCEHLLPSQGAEDSNAALRCRIQDKIQKSKSELVAIGYSDVAIDAFWETFVDYLAAMETRSYAELVQDFQTEGGEAEYLVWYMRLLTAGYMKKHAERFQPFIDGLCPGQTVAQFCATEVEPMGKECDQPQIAALTEALEVGVKIEYLDGSAGAGEPLQSYVCSAVDATERQVPVFITLLYRPGHYDILYPRERGKEHEHET
uniref:ubiquitinyl hydrolase 1 n=1 Tax=Peronospora matthiolae TaxID=2874970 RepID=A0AAV1U8R6_9STRA